MNMLLVKEGFSLNIFILIEIRLYRFMVNIGDKSFISYLVEEL